MKKFIINVGIFCIPFGILTSLYVVLDPFKVLYHYDSYFNEKENGAVFLNSDYVATSNFENKFKLTGYNSFIIGNSRAWFYRISDWQEYIGNEPAYHFDAAGETLYAMHKKILYLDRLDVPIKNALLVMDQELLSSIELKKTHLGMISPQLVNNQNWFDFHAASLKGFFNLQFMYCYFDLKMNGKVKPYMVKNNLVESRPFGYNAETNELSFYYFEHLIERDEYYTNERMKVFYTRNEDVKYAPVSIYEPQKEMLTDIAAVFKKHGTNCHVIISPLYCQQYLAMADLEFLNITFGKDNVHDFSGVNPVTRDYTNYYESSHYRPSAAKKLLDHVYGQSQDIMDNELRAELKELDVRKN